MMMTEKCCTLPSTSSYCYSTIYPPSTPNSHIHEIKSRLHSQKSQIPTTYDHDNMKLLDEQQPSIRTYSLYDVQERINYFEKKTSSEHNENSLKETIHSNPSLIPTFSLSSPETLQSVIAHTLQQTFYNHSSYGSALSRTLMNSTNNGSLIGKRRSLSTSQLVCPNDPKLCSTRYCSQLSKRLRTYSLSNHLTMRIPSIVHNTDEQHTEQHETTSNDYENTYFYPEETTRIDDILSLTTITSNIPVKINNTQHDVSVSSDTTLFPSDTEENSEVMRSNIQQSDMAQEKKNIRHNDEQLTRMRINLTPIDQDFTGVVHAKKCTVIKEHKRLSDYDNANHCSKQDNKIRSNRDNVSLNKSMTSPLQYEHNRRIATDDQQQNQQSRRTSHSESNGDVYCQANQQSTVHSAKMNHDIEMMIRQDNDDNDDGHYSDDSCCSDELKYSSDAARNSCASDDLNNTSSTLRQEAISITRVRCKRRKTWIRSPTSPAQSPDNSNITNTKPISSYLQHHRLNSNLIQQFSSNHQVDGTDARQSASVNSPRITKTATSTCANQTRAKTTVSKMLLHNSSLDCNNNKSKYAETASYDFVPFDDDYQPINADDSPRSKVTSSLIKDTPSSSSSKTNEFYPASLSPVKRLLNESIDSNIEIIQMDEQECILEIVDGVLTIVPKEKSSSSFISNGDDDEKLRPIQPTINYNSSKHQKQRSSSIASSSSTPSLSEHEQERDESSSTSSSRLSSKPFVISHDVPLTKPFLSTEPQHQSADVLDLFSTPIISNHKNRRNLLNDSLSSVSSVGDRSIPTKRQQTNIPRSSSPINNKSTLSSIKDTSSLPTIENQTRSNKNTVLNQLLATVKKTSTDNDTNIETPKIDHPKLKTEPIPVPKPINKDRINEFATLLSSSVHLSQPTQPVKKPITSTSKTIISPTRADEHSFSSTPSSNSDHDERESYHTVKSNNSEQHEPTKRHIDARYNDKLDDRGSIKIKTANIKALFEQKISDTNKTLSQSTEHLSHLPEVRQHHKKIPISYGSLRRNFPNYQQTAAPIIGRRNSYQDSPTMIKYTDHIAGAKDVIIEDKKPENGTLGNHVRRNTIEQLARSFSNSTSSSPMPSSNGHHESLLAREIREAKEKEEELKQQRKKCGFVDDDSTLMSMSMNESIRSEIVHPPPVKSNSFLSNLDFFTSKTNGSLNDSSSTVSSPRRSVSTVQTLIPDSHCLSPAISHRPSSIDELKQINQVVSQELNRFNENGISVVRPGSTNGVLYRSSSNQNINSAHQNNVNIIQREVEAIRAKEAELRELGRIQHTSDEHADPRKYQELISTITKSQSINTLSAGKLRRDSDSQPMSRQNGFPKSKSSNHCAAISSVRGKFPSPNPSAPIISSSNKSNDYSKLSTTDRLELEKRQCQEREQELKQQRTSVNISSSPTNGDSDHTSQEEHDVEQERYFDKIERLKRTEIEKAHAPLIRPTKKLDLSHKWEQMVAHKIDD